MRTNNAAGTGSWPQSPPFYAPRHFTNLDGDIGAPSSTYSRTCTPDLGTEPPTPTDSYTPTGGFSDPEPSDPESSDPEPSDPEPSDPELSDPELSYPEPPVLHWFKGGCICTMGIGKCPCDDGSCRIVINSEPKCEKCRHPMSMHASKYNPPSQQLADVTPRKRKRRDSRETGIYDPSIKYPKCSDCSHSKGEHGNNVPDPPNQSLTALTAFIEDRANCPRDKTVETLATLLNKEKVVFVRGTPLTGKTALAMLLHHFLLGKGEVVVYIDRWGEHIHTRGEPADAKSCLVQQCRTSGYTNISEDNVLTSNIVFLIDDSEKSYSCRVLWDKIIIPQGTGKKTRPYNEGARFCLFSTCKDQPHITSQIPTFGQTQIVSLAVSTQLGAPAISLCYNETEFADVVRRFHDNPEKKPAIEKEAQEYIFSFTNGHPGAVRFMLEYIHHYRRFPLQPCHDITITMEDVRKIMADIDSLCGELEGSVMKKSLPLTTYDYKETLLRMLQFGSLDPSRYPSHLSNGAAQGWLQSDRVEGGRIAYTFASGLHAMYMEYRIGKSHQHTLFSGMYGNIGTLCLEVVKIFSTTSLRRNFEGKTIGPGGKRRSRETAFRDEFYRCFLQLTNGKSRINREWAGGNSGQIDFFLPGPDWGVNLLMDGEDITEHCGHFQQGGKFYSLINTGKLKECLIMDCRHSYPEKHCE
ncbi:hypothetical protein FQN55_006524 [Onygenales sp. PD_40]|nr:hypothetical protein FQN55_006524 [Onygenales sp. PD_40]